MHNFALFYFYSIAQTVDYVKVYPLFSKIFRSKEAKPKDFKINISKSVFFLPKSRLFYVTTNTFMFKTHKCLFLFRS